MPLVALMIFAGELGMPTIVPMEVALLLVGGYAVPSLPFLLGGLLLVAAADLAGTMLFYMAVRTGGRRLIARLLRRHAVHGDGLMTRWRHRLHGYDVGLVCLGRAVPLARMYVPVGAGLAGVAPRDYLLGTAAGGTVWAGTPLVAGYLFRSDVRRIAANYTRLEHLLLMVLPAVAIAVTAAWWIRAGASGWARLRRSRAAIGVATAIGVAAYVAAAAVANDRAADSGVAALPLAVLVVWSGLLAGLATALLALAVSDLRAARAPERTRAGPIRTELVGTLAWAGLVGIVGLLMVALEWRYPGL